MTERKYGWRTLAGSRHRTWSMISEPGYGAYGEPVEWLEVVPLKEIGQRLFHRDPSDFKLWRVMAGPLSIETLRGHEYANKDTVYILMDQEGHQIAVGGMQNPSISVYVPLRERPVDD